MSNRIILFGREVSPDNPEDGHKYADLTRWLLRDAPTRRPTVFFIDLPGKCFEARIRSSHKGYFMVLVRVEPRTVNPRQFVPSIYKRFDAVIGGHETPNTFFTTWSTGYAPQISARTGSIQEAKKGIVIVASRKISLVEGELYSARDSVIEALANAGNSVTVIGDGWGSPRTKPVLASLVRTPRTLRKSSLVWANVYRWYFKKPKNERINYLGVRSDAEFQMSSHQCTLVIENENTYVSEKLVNALQASRKVLYLGKELSFPDPSCGCLKAYSNSDHLISDIESGLMNEFIDLEPACSPSSHKETKELIMSLEVEPRIEQLKKILTKVVTGA